MKILFEKEVIQYLDIPSIPVKRHDKKSSFKCGVAVLTLISEQKAYAICSFDKDVDAEPRIVKVFGVEPYKSIDEIFVVPSYMDCDTDDADLDDVSKKRAARLVEEAREIENEGVEKNDELENPKNEYYFDHITNDDEAKAFIQSYNSRNRIKGRIPTTHDGLVMRLAVIYSDTQKKKK